MTHHELPSSAQITEETHQVDTKETLIPPEDFIRRLYTESYKWLTEQLDAKEIVRFDKENVLEWGARYKASPFDSAALERGTIDGEDIVFQEIRNWDAAEGRHASTVYLDLDLEEGVILRDEHNEYGLVLGNRHHRHIEPGLSFQFGYFRNNGETIKDATSRLKVLTHTEINHAASGSFEIIRNAPFLSIGVDGRLNSWQNGGEGLYDLNNSLRTQEGFEKSMVFVKDTLTRGHRSPTLR